jgi:anhydro-N-acetylmuramic acid kinase
MYTALGFMSGTSLDGVDAAVIRTDGRGYVEPLACAHAPYEESLRGALRACLGQRAAPAEVVRALTDVHLDLYRHCEEGLTEARRSNPEQGAQDWVASGPQAGPRNDGKSINLIGFPGQTLYHNAPERITIQVGDAARLAKETGRIVISDFRSADIAAGGQGAPLIPLYHAALAEKLPKPLNILNLGGVGNVTALQNDTVRAWDTGPGGALLDDFIQKRTGAFYDVGGALAAQGAADEALLQKWLAHPYFSRPPPKSLDRNAFLPCLADVEPLSTPDGAATLAAFTARAARHIPLPGPLYVTGGGRKNVHILNLLDAKPVEALGWDGDALEAQGFAYLAVRSLLGLPLTMPQTTGAPRPMTGGRLWMPAGA